VLGVGAKPLTRLTALPLLFVIEIVEGTAIVIIASPKT